MLQTRVVKFETVTCLVAGNKPEKMSNTVSRSIYLIQILQDFLTRVTDIIELFWSNFTAAILVFSMIESEMK